MTEFWVSKAKHYCKYCKSWMQGNPKVISQHEKLDGHKFNVKKFFSEQRREKVEQDRRSQEISSQFHQIEREALASFERQDQSMGSLDRARNAAFAAAQAAQRGGSSVPPPPEEVRQPPPPAERVSAPIPMMSFVPHPKRMLDQRTGLYTVKGVTYMQGQHFPDLLVPSAQCEVFYENKQSGEGKWYQSAIAAVNHETIPNTDLEIITYTVTYVGEGVSEAGVTPDRIRLVKKAPAVPSQKHLRQIWKKEQERAKKHSPTANPVRVTTSGSSSAPVAEEEVESSKIGAVKERKATEPTVVSVGGWETVAVTSVQERDEEKSKAEKFREAVLVYQVKEEMPDTSELLANPKEEVASEEEEGDDAYSLVNPFGGSYRGVPVEEKKKEGSKPVLIVTPAFLPKQTTVYGGEAQPSSSSGRVAFKKRKAPPGGRPRPARKRRRADSSSEEGE